MNQTFCRAAHDRPARILPAAITHRKNAPPGVVGRRSGYALAPPGHPRQESHPDCRCRLTLIVAGQWCAYFGVQCCYSVEQLAAVPDKSDTKVLQVLRRQPRQDRVVDPILAECRLILFEAKPPQPTSDIHGGAPAAHLAMILIETACLGYAFLRLHWIEAEAGPAAPR